MLKLKRYDKGATRGQTSCLCLSLSPFICLSLNFCVSLFTPHRIRGMMKQRQGGSISKCLRKRMLTLQLCSIVIQTIFIDTYCLHSCEGKFLSHFAFRNKAYRNGIGNLTSFRMWQSHSFYFQFHSLILFVLACEYIHIQHTVSL